MRKKLNYYEGFSIMAQETLEILKILKEDLYTFEVNLERSGYEHVIPHLEKHNDAYRKIKKMLYEDLFPPIDREDIFLFIRSLKELCFYAEQLVLATGKIPIDEMPEALVEASDSLEKITEELLFVVHDLIHIERHDILSQRIDEIDLLIYEKHKQLLEVIDSDLYYLTDFFHRAFQTLQDLTARVNLILLKYS
ncbi:hypothetical protein [Guggenheimella bovis]